MSNRRKEHIKFAGRELKVPDLVHKYSDTYICKYSLSGFEKIDFILKPYNSYDNSRNITIEYEGIDFGVKYDFGNKPPPWHGTIRIPSMKDDRFPNEHSYFLKSNINTEWWFIIWGPAISKFKEVYVPNRRELWNKGMFRTVSDNHLHLNQLGLCWCSFVDVLNFIDFKSNVKILSNKYKNEINKRPIIPQKEDIEPLI